MATYTQEDVDSLIEGCLCKPLKNYGPEWLIDMHIETLTTPMRQQVFNCLMKYAVALSSYDYLFAAYGVAPQNEMGASALQIVLNSHLDPFHTEDLANDSILNNAIPCSVVRKFLANWSHEIDPSIVELARWYVRTAKARDEWEGDVDDLAIAAMAKA